MKYAAITVIGLVLASGARADMIVWDFNLPSTATASQNPPYPTLGTLTLEDILGGVKFTLDPDESNPGYIKNNNLSHVIGIDFVYSGTPLVDPVCVNESGLPTIKSCNYVANPNNVDSGYTAMDQHIQIMWNTGQGQQPAAFLVDQIAMWEILGTTLADFTGTSATSGPKPSPISAVLSVSAYSGNPKPSPSNWVAGTGGGTPPTPVPEPGTLTLLGIGLVGMGLTRRRKQI